MNKFIITLGLLVLAFSYTTTPHYGNCHTTVDGRVCDLQGYTWNK